MIFSKIAIAMLSLANGARPAEHATTQPEPSTKHECNLYKNALKYNTPNALDNGYDKDFESWSLVKQYDYLIKNGELPKDKTEIISSFEKECRRKLPMDHYELKTPYYTCDSVMYNTVFNTKHIIPDILSYPVADSICSVNDTTYITSKRARWKIIVSANSEKIKQAIKSKSSSSLALPDMNNAIQNLFIGCVEAETKNVLENLITYIGYKLGCEKSFSWKYIESEEVSELITHIGDKLGCEKPASWECVESRLDMYKKITSHISGIN